jgi:phosphohistidine phosphatase
MQIVLWRHAEAEDQLTTDLARRLTPRGHKQAEKMSAWLKIQLGNELEQWRIIASPALRTQQTAEALGLPFETVATIAPDASPDAVIDAVRWPMSEASVIVVGHQPTLGMVAARLINGADGYVAIKKGAMWWFETRQRYGRDQVVLKAMVSPDAVV